MRQIFVGTSGWLYKHWKDKFYPKDLPYEKWLSYYSQHFDTVEVNSTFYHSVRTETVKKWKVQVPKHFIFSLKAHRFITHIKRMKNCEDPLEKFFNSVNVLKDNHHVILWQLPSNLKQDNNLLENFLRLLPKDFRYAFEFRHSSWISEETYTLLKKYNVAVVFQDWPKWPQIRSSTADYVYIRLHGSKMLYSSSYSKEELLQWSETINQFLAEGKDVYAYFNNDAKGYAVENALMLKTLLYTGR